MPTPEIAEEGLQKGVAAGSFLVVLIGEDRFGFPVQAVREVIRAVWVTPLPGAPPVVMGVIDVRGHFVPVIDLRRRFGMETTALSPADRFVIVWTGREQVAFRVDRADWFETIDTVEAVETADPFRRDEGVAGVARTSSGIVVLVDATAFLDEAQSKEIEAAMRALQRGVTS